MASFSTLSASSSSFSSSTPRRTYEVFLSFYGKDTRNTFTDHLHTALLQKGINVFRDDEKLKRGEDISQELFEAIEESQYAIVVISENYAFSKWCLAELTKIMKCWTQTQIKVFPVFYHVNPSDVRKRKRTFAEAFAEHIKVPEVNKEEMEAWKIALEKVGNLAGWHVYDRSEAKVVEEISTKILHELNPKILNISKHLVGMKSRVEELKTLLSIRCDDVRCIGVYGISGIGKTTLAKVIYDKTSSEFEVSCFLAEDEHVWKYRGMEVINNRFFGKKFLLVVDDVDGKKHLEVLEMIEGALSDENCNQFSPGSRIILTSRDCHLIKRYVNYDFKVKELDDAEALELFSLKAFKKSSPQKDYLKFSKDIVRYAEGFPLAIEVFGSFFFGKSMDAWRSGQKWLEVNLDKGILNKLKISFDKLEDIQKQLFLDIACFFNGRSSNWLRHILESFGYFPEINIGVLMDKSLIKIKEEKIWMHNLLVQMGQQIAKDEMYKCNRLWHYEDVIDVLKNNTSIDAIEGIRLLIHDGNEVVLNLEAFSKMQKLRMIEIIPKGSHFEDYFCEVTHKNHSLKNITNWTSKWSWHTNLFKFILKDSYPLEVMPTNFKQCLGKLKWTGHNSKFMLSDKLCLLNWFQCPLHSLPTTFQSKNLVELRLPCSHVKILWNGSKSFGKLRVIHLNYSINLTETPDLTNVSNLEKLELSYCTSLSKIHPSIGFLKWLKWLDLSGCKSLKNLPKNLGCVESLEELNICRTSIKELPSSICSLKKLKVLKGGGIVSNPVSLQLSKSFSSLSSLESLSLEYCNLSDRIIPNNLDSLSSLKKLFLRGNKFKSTPKFVWKLSKLEQLDLSNCNLLDGDGGIPNDIGYLPSLKKLFLNGNKFKSVPEFVWKLSKLETLNLSHCNLLDGGIPNDISCLSSLSHLFLLGNKFTTISNSISQLPKLDWLDLKYNSKLQALPKLPRSLTALWRSNCPLLDFSSMHKWDSGVRICKNTFGVSYYDYDGKSYKILYTDSEYTSTSLLRQKWVHVDVACGPTLEYEIHEWFETRSNGSYEIQGRIQESEIWNLIGIALFIVYEVRESSNSKGSNDSNPAIVEIACQMRCERTGSESLESLESRVVEVSPSGRTGFERQRNGAWVFLLNQTRWECFITWNSLEGADFTFSVLAKSPNIEVKEYGTRGVYEADKEDWCRVLSEISFHGWATKSFADFYSHSFGTCYYF